MNKKHTALTYSYPELVDAILSPVELFFDIYNDLNSYTTNALWDTGAMLSVISPEVVSKLKLYIVDTVKILGINSESEESLAVVSVRFPNGTEIKDIRAAVCKMDQENEMIIGMDIITQMDLAITNGGGQTQLSFVIPPLEDKIDFSSSLD